MPHAFRPPFKLIEHEWSLEITDSSGNRLAFIYYDDDESRRSVGNKLTKAEAMSAAGVFLRGLIAEARPKPIGKIGEGGEATFPDPEG